MTALPDYDVNAVLYASRTLERVQVNQCSGSFTKTGAICFIPCKLSYVGDWLIGIGDYSPNP